MTKLSKVVVGVAVVGGLAIIGAQFARQLTGRAPVPTEKTKVGVILPLTGELSFVGQEIEKGIQLALADFPEAGIKVVVEDNESLNTSKAVSALQKLVFVDKVNVVLNDAVNTAKALVSTVDQAQISTIIVWDSNEQLRNLHSHIFGFGFSTEKAGQDAAHLAVSTQAAKKVAVISLHDEWSEIIANAFAEETKSLGAEVVIHEKFNVGETDFRTVIAKIKNQKVDAVFFPFPFPDSIINFAKQARELNLEASLITGDGFVGVDLKTAGEVLENVYAVLPWVTDPALETKYAARFGNSNSVSLAFAGLGYDAVKLIVDTKTSLESSHQAINSETLYQALKQVESQGFLGTTNFGTSNIADKQEKITVIKNGQLQLVE